MITVHHVAALRTDIGPVGKFQLFMDMTAVHAGLTGMEPLIHFYEKSAVLQTFPFKDTGEHPPAVVRYGLAKPQCLFHGGHVEVLDTDHIIAPRKADGSLVQEVAALVLGSRMQPCDLHTLLPVVGGVFYHTAGSPRTVLAGTYPARCA